MRLLRPTTLIACLLATCLSGLRSQDNPLSADFGWRAIGPASQGGRIVDVEAVEADFTKVFAATASGGLWYSGNAGTTWTPIFDNYETASIGDIAVFQPNPAIIWAGTGEANNRNSTSWGNGIYKSTDGGKHFNLTGLENTHHISRVVTHPANPDEVCACATGHLWGYSGDRGLFITKNGGKSWDKLTNGLPDDGKTGCTDLVRDPKDPNTLYAAFYHRLRQPWTFESGGPNGGIFKSTDGGKSWKKLTNGLPAGPTGRIGLDIYRKNPKTLVALIEAPRTDDLSTPGTGVYRSDDGGKSWKYLNNYNNRPFYYSQIRINPSDDKRVYLLTTRFMVSADGGKTFVNGSADEEVHGDFHAMWIDPKDPERFYLGADKGLSLTQDNGDHFTLFDNLPIGQFYRIGLDMRDPYYIYGGLQDNGFYAVASFSRDARGILNDSHWKVHWGDGQFGAVDPDDWRTVYTSSENGGYIRYDPLTHRIVRISPTVQNVINLAGTVPEADIKTGRPFRFNWSAPMRLSPHPSKNLYSGGNYLFKSADKGETWQIISPDLSTRAPEKTLTGKSGGITPDNTGAETHCSITTIAISPIDEQVIWVGTDDGQVQLTRDGGLTWNNLRANLPEVPQGIWVSRLEASGFDPAVAYLSFDGHRSDDFGTWVYRTEDFGKSWKKIGTGFPQGSVVRVIREDPMNPKLLYAGTETGVFASLDAGSSWFGLTEGMPTVSVYDLKVHPRDHDLVAATHGRSIYILDDVYPIQQWSTGIAAAEAWLFEQSVQTIWENTSRGGQRGHFWFAGANPPEVVNTSSIPRAAFTSQALISYYIGDPGAGPAATLVIEDERGRHQTTLEPTKGIHRYRWNREFDAVPYTKEEEQEIESWFTHLRQQYPSNTLESTIRRFREATTPRGKRAQIDNLRTGFLSIPIDESLGLPVAGPGSYRLTLTYAGKSMVRTLVIREDPLLASP